MIEQINTNRSDTSCNYDIAINSPKNTFHDNKTNSNEATDNVDLEHIINITEQILNNDTNFIINEDTEQII